MIFNMTNISDINCQIEQYNDYSLLPRTSAEKTLAIITDTQISNYGFGQKNPFISYLDTDLLEKASWEEGSISAAGAIVATNATNQDKFSSYINVDSQKKYRFEYSIQSSKAMLLLVAEYTIGDDGQYIFNTRKNLVDATGTGRMGYYVPSSNEIVAIKVVVRTFGILEEIKLIEEQKEFNQNNIENGTLWISTATLSPFCLDLLNYNSLKVYLVGAWQYITGKWNRKEIYVYQDGWQPIEYALYSNGLINEQFTGGWFSQGKVYKSNAGSVTLGPTVSYESGKMIIKSASSKSGIVTCANKIDLSAYTKLSFRGRLYYTSTNPYADLCIWSELGTYWSDNVVKSISSNLEGEAEIDISSLKGEYYIGFGLYGAAAEVQMEKLILI